MVLRSRRRKISIVGWFVHHSGGSGTPLSRRGRRPEKAAAVAVFLASTEAAYVSGQVFVVDGGNIIQEPHGIDLYGVARTRGGPNADQVAGC